MNTTVRRALWVVLVLLCLGLVFLALRGVLAVGAVPISAAPTLGATASATPSPSPSPSSARFTPSPATTATPTPTPSPSSASPTREAAVPVETQELAGTPTPSEEPTPTEEPAPAAAAHLSGPAAPWDEVTATPVHVDVHQDGEQIVGAGIDLTQLDEGGELDPEPQTVGWYGPPQWGTTPGERSRYAGVLAGHVVYYGVRDVFWNLGDVRAGAVVVVTYEDRKSVV